MKSKVVFFDSLQNSLNGTYRSFIMLPFLAAVYIGWSIVVPWSPMNQSNDEITTGRKVLAFFVLAAVVLPAIATHHPDTIKKAAVYGALIGLVVHSVVTCALLMSDPAWDIPHALTDIVFGIVAVSCSATLLYLIVDRNPQLGVV
jgi:uncharacterized membrane protein YagU involved in acid resistance